MARRKIFCVFATLECFHSYSQYPFDTRLLLEMPRVSRCSWWEQFAPKYARIMMYREDAIFQGASPPPPRPPPSLFPSFRIRDLSTLSPILANNYWYSDTFRNTGRHSIERMTPKCARKKYTYRKIYLWRRGHRIERSRGSCYLSRRFRDYGLKLSPLPDVYFYFDLYIRLKWIKNDAEQLRRNSTAASTKREVFAGQRNLWRHATSPNFTPQRGGKFSTREYIFANSSRFLSNVTLCPVLKED